MKKDHQHHFTQALLSWYKTDQRDLPWRQTTDPYTIWLSEIILQQTQIAQGLPYFNKMLNVFPTVQALAAASEDELLALWAGLGYYSRARHLHHTAKIIVTQYGGNFPADYKELLKLPGIGPYTAAALSSFAFGIPKAVVDGNVYRLLSRFWGIALPIDQGAGRRYFEKLASALLPAKEHATYNQAIMDFGATQCKPKNPACGSCLLRHHCNAYLEDKVALLPYKSIKLVKQVRHFYYFIFQTPDQGSYLRKRGEHDIWKGLYDFYLIESAESVSDWRQIKDPLVDELIRLKIKVSALHAREGKDGKAIKHLLTHQTLYLSFFTIQLPDTLDFNKPSKQNRPTAQKVKRQEKRAAPKHHLSRVGELLREKKLAYFSAAATQKLPLPVVLHRIRGRLQSKLAVR